MKSSVVWAATILLLHAHYSVEGQKYLACDGSKNWHCDSGECISTEKRCDGRVDCSDGSDETVEACISFQCSSDNFRCAYGACVNETSICDGVKDCADNSDELVGECSKLISRSKRRVKSYDCRTLPCKTSYCDSPQGFRCGIGICIDSFKKCDGKYDCIDGSDENRSMCEAEEKKYSGKCQIKGVPRNGWSRVFIEHAVKGRVLQPGDWINSKDSFSYECPENNYWLDGSGIASCISGRIVPHQIPNCQPACNPKVINRPSFRTSNCKFQPTYYLTQRLNCAWPAKIGATANIYCREGYELRDPSETYQTVICNDRQVWSSLILCTPIWGEKLPKDTTIFVDGFDCCQGAASCNRWESWRCKSGECISTEKRCDGRVDCSDGSDETVETCIALQCPSDKFRCAYGACVNKTSICNGVRDCADNSDEYAGDCRYIQKTKRIFSKKCWKSKNFECLNGDCVDYGHICDGDKDCSDGSDEAVDACGVWNCDPPSGFRCGYGGCIHINGRCDGKNDCLDGSDENHLLCGYPKDGVPFDCQDASDEILEICASRICSSSSFRCGYGACIDRQLMCDGNNDCLDGSDENNVMCLYSVT